MPRLTRIFPLTLCDVIASDDFDFTDMEHQDLPTMDQDFVDILNAILRYWNWH